MDINKKVNSSAILSGVKTERKVDVEIFSRFTARYEEMEELGLYQLDKTEAKLVAAWRSADEKARRVTAAGLSEYGFDYLAKENDADILRAAAETMDIPVGTMLSLCRRKMDAGRAEKLLNRVAKEPRNPEESGQAVGE